MNLFLSGLLYLTVIFVSVFFVYISERKGKSCGKTSVYSTNRNITAVNRNKHGSIKNIIPLVIAVILPSILAGLRSDEIGTDVLVYGKLMMQEADRVSSFAELNRIDTTYTEYGYRFFAYLISRIFNGTGWLLFYTEILILGCVIYTLYAFKDDISMWKGYAYYMFCQYHVSLNLMRQSMAIAILLVSFCYLRRNKYLKFLVSSLIATTIHSFSLIIAILMLIIWLVKDSIKTRHRKKLFITFSIGLVVFWQYIVIFLSRILTGPLYRYARYLVDNNSSFVPLHAVLTSPSFLINLFFFITAYITMNNQKNDSKDYDNVLFFYSVLGIVGTFLQVYLTIMYRLGINFIAFNNIYLPRVLEMRSRLSKKNRSIIYVLLFFLYWLADCMLSGHSSTAIYLFR